MHFFNWTYTLHGVNVYKFIEHFVVDLIDKTTLDVLNFVGSLLKNTLLNKHKFCNDSNTLSCLRDFEFGCG